MAELSLKEQFSRSLRGVLQKSGVPRGELIRRLKVSASALSQMLNGSLLPTLQRLDRIIEVLRPSVREAENLQTMLLWLRSGVSRCPSAFNRRLFMARCRRGLTIEQLAKLSTFPVARLRRLERTAYAEPTGDELLALSRLLEYPLSDDPLFAASVNGERKDLPAVAESELMALPQITGDVLRQYPGKGDFPNFALAHYLQYLSFRDLPGEAAAVICGKARDFELALPGNVELVLAERRPHGFAKLDLCCLKQDGDFFLDGGAGGVPVPGKRRRGSVRWRLPVVMVNFTPEGVSDEH